MGWGQACRRKITSKIYRKIKQWFEARKKCTMTSGCSIFFVFPPLLLAAEGPLTQGCFTGQPPGIDCFYTRQSPGVLVVGKVYVQTFLYRAGRRLTSMGGVVCERRWPSGGRSPSWLWWGEKSSKSRLAAKEVAAA